MLAQTGSEPQERVRNGNDLPSRRVGMKGASILIADDDTAARTYLARFIASCGYMPTCVSSKAKVSAGNRGLLPQNLKH